MTEKFGFLVCASAILSKQNARVWVEAVAIQCESRMEMVCVGWGRTAVTHPGSRSGQALLPLCVTGHCTVFHKSQIWAQIRNTDAAARKGGVYCKGEGEVGLGNL